MTETDPQVVEYARSLATHAPEDCSFEDVLEIAQAVEDDVREEEDDARVLLTADPAYTAWLDELEALATGERNEEPIPLPAKGIAHAACGIDPMTTWPEEGGPQQSTEDFTPASEGFRQGG